MNEKRRGHDASCQIWSQLRQIYGKWPQPYFLLGSHLSQGARELNTHKLALFPFSSGSALWPSGAKHSILAALSPESPLLPAAYLNWMQPTVLCLFSSGTALHHSQNDFFPFCWSTWSLRTVCCATHHVPYTKSPKTQKLRRRNEDDYAPAS